MKNMLTVSSSPHFRDDMSIRGIMATVLLALLPVLIMSTVTYGFRVLGVSAVSVLTCVLAEYLFNIIVKRPSTVLDLSCVVTGLLFAFCLPVQISYVAVFFGALFASVVGKMLFGGLGKYPFSPALIAKVFLMTWVSYPTIALQAFAQNKLDFGWDSFFGGELSAETTTTLLGTLKAGEPFEGSALGVLIGSYGGNIGETCLALLALGGIFLIVSRVYTWHVPVAFVAGICAGSLLIPYGGEIFSLDHLILQLCSGGTVLIAFFIAPDYAVCPVTSNGRLVYGLGCGILTVVLRLIGCPGDGAVFAVLFMNMFADKLDELTKPRHYGKRGAKQ